jgi:hypothetical protein
MDKKIEVLQAATNFLCGWFDQKLKGQAAYSGNGIAIKFSGYPLYPTGSPGDVIFTLPSDYVTVSSSGIRFQSLQQADVRIYQQSNGTAFAHPHVFPNGTPCWAGHPRQAIQEVFAYILYTMLYVNVSRQSLEIGHPCRGTVIVNDAAENFDRILAIVKKQQATLLRVLNLHEDVFKVTHFPKWFTKNMMLAQSAIMKK